VSVARAWRQGDMPTRIVAVALVALVLTYLAAWVALSPRWLFDPWVQHDDVATILPAFHRYGPERALQDDVSAREMSGLVPVGFHAVYAILVPLLGLPASVKAVQGLCLALLVATGWACARRRGGLALGALVVVLSLHHWFMVGRIAGGLPRAFAPPLLVLFGTGLVQGSVRRRVACTIAAATLYPPAMMLLLGAEGLSSVVAGGPWRGRAARARWLRLLAVTAACAALSLAHVARHADLGPAPSVAEAEATGTFGPRGRSQDLPFRDSAMTWALALAQVVMPPPQEPAGQAVVDWHRRQDSTFALVLAALLGTLVLARLTSVRREVACLLLAPLLLHAVARLVAFRLYVPSRHLTFGAAAAGAVIVAALVAGIGPGLPPRRRSLVRLACAAVFLTALLGVSGTGAARMLGMTVSPPPALVAALRELPPDARLLAHPEDGNIPPFWAARAVVSSLETLQPWHLGAWEAELRRAKDSLRAVHATDRGDVAAIVRGQDVSHLLLRRGRLHAGSLDESAEVDEPLGAFVRGLLASASRPPVLADVPPEAIVWQDPAWILVDAARLLRAWEK
jgi:hypothetical protein